MTRLRPAAFLDRDGILNERPAEHAYVRSVDELHVLPDAGRAVSVLMDAGYVPIVVSNQQGIARGLVTWETLEHIESRLREAGVDAAAFYYCPHLADAGCACRKPKPGMLLKAAQDHGLDLAQSVLIGDAESDVLAGRAAGTRTIRVSGDCTSAEAVADDVRAAAEIAAAWSRDNLEPAR